MFTVHVNTNYPERMVIELIILISFDFISCVQVFERKVREKKQKLMDNEGDLERRQTEAANR